MTSAAIKSATNYVNPITQNDFSQIYIKYGHCAALHWAVKQIYNLKSSNLP